MTKALKAFWRNSGSRSSGCRRDGFFQRACSTVQTLSVSSCSHFLSRSIVAIHSLRPLPPPACSGRAEAVFWRRPRRGAASRSRVISRIVPPDRGRPVSVRTGTARAVSVRTGTGRADTVRVSAGREGTGRIQASSGYPVTGSGAQPRVQLGRARASPGYRDPCRSPANGSAARTWTGRASREPGRSSHGDRRPASEADILVLSIWSVQLSAHDSQSSWGGTVLRLLPFPLFL